MASGPTRCKKSFENLFKLIDSGVHSVMPVLIHMRALKMTCIIVFAQALSISHFPAKAQVSVVRAGSFEAGGFVGASYGLDDFRPMGGGNVTYAATRWLLPYFEYSDFPSIERQGQLYVNGLQTTVKYAIPLADIHGGAHIRIPIRESRFVPYGVFGVGVLHQFEHNSEVSYVNGSIRTVPFSFGANNYPAINFGGGIRYYMTERVGIRAEAKLYRPFEGQTGVQTSSGSAPPSSAVFGKLEVGFFFQFR